MEKKADKLTREAFLSATDEQRWALVSTLLAEKERLAGELAELQELLRMRTAVQYKPSTEQLQLFFPEFELLGLSLEGDGDVKTVHVKEHDKKVRKQRTVTSLPPNTPVYVVDHTKEAPMTKEENGVEYLRGEDRIVDKAAFIPARVVIEQHVWPTYIPADNENSRVVAYDDAKLDTISCSASLVAQIVVAKMDDHMPLFRQEEIWQRHGLKISRQNMARWVILYYKRLMVLEKLIKKWIYEANANHKDETRVQVLDFKDKTGKPSTNIFMIVTISSCWDSKERRFRHLVLFQVSKGRSIDSLMGDMREYNFTGYLTTDGLQGYTHYDDSKHCTCWVHAVRGFKNILKSDASNEAAKTVVKMVRDLYKIENRWQDALLSGEVDEESFLKGRAQEAGAQIDSIYSYVDTERGNYTLTSPTGKAFAYIAERKASLKRHLEFVEGVADNNIAERAIRPFTVGRGNWIFCKSQDGAKATAFFYSLVESAKLCGLNPYDYLEAVFTLAPATREEDMEQLLPWNIDLSILDPIRQSRNEARPVEGNTREYFLSGGNGC